jgi:hypothetical protein
MAGEPSRATYGVRGKPGNSLTLVDVEKLDTIRTIDLGDYQRPQTAAE